MQSRREFFKEAAKRALPILGMVVFSTMPLNNFAQSYNCNDECLYNCKQSCLARCLGCCYEDPCGGVCAGTCRKECTGTCNASCYGTCTMQNTNATDTNKIDSDKNK